MGLLPGTGRSSPEDVMGSCDGDCAARVVAGQRNVAMEVAREVARRRVDRRVLRKGEG